MFTKSSVSAGSNTQFWSFTVRAGSRLLHDLDFKKWYQNLEHEILATDLFTLLASVYWVSRSAGVPISLCNVMNAVVWLAISLAKMYKNVSLPIARMVNQAYSIAPN